MSDRKSLFFLISIMAMVVVVAGSVGIYVLYNAAFEQQQALLVETVVSQARLMEAVARFHVEHSDGDLRKKPHAAALSQITDAHKRYEGLRQTGEFVLAKREGEQIVFLLRHRDQDLDNPEPVPFDSNLAEPMRQALSGRSGTTVGRDYRGVPVLAAFEPVALLNWGIVAKIDLAEIRAPFLRAGIIAALAAILAILVAAVMFFRITDPLIRRVVESEIKTRTIVQTAVDGIITIDEAGVVQSFNPAAERLFGHAANKVIGKNVKMLMPDPFYQEHDAYIENYRQSDQKKMIGIGREVVGMRKDGATFPMQLSVSEFFLGTQRMFTAIVRDIGERIQAQKALQESQRSLATLMSNLPGMVYRCRNDQDWTMEFVSEGCVDLTGYQPSDLVGNKRLAYSSLIHQADQKMVAEHVQKAVSECRPFRVVYRIRTATGKQKWVWEQSQIVCSANGTLTSLEGFITDITDRVHAEQSLQASEARIRAIVETAVDAIITTNEHGIIESVNSAVERLFGYAPDEVVGQNVSMLMPLPFRVEHHGYIKSYLQTGEKKIIGIGRESIGRRKDGTTFPIRLSVSEFFLGERRMFTGLIHDITEQKAMEQRILQSERLAVIGRMAAKIAHEVRNPLSSISLNAELLEEELQGLAVCDTEEARSLLQSMINEIDRVTSLTDEYLQFSRLPESNLVEGDLNELLREMLELLTPELKQKRIELESRGLKQKLELPFDRAQVRRVLLNLIRNAIEAMPKGGLLKVWSMRNAHTAVISIRDTGCGIPQHLVGNIFSPFFTTKDFGTGLGLAISQQVINEHQGQITCESNVEQGTTFRIELPIREHK
ncbi:MAG: PAS domain S-box protein [bacterium]